MGGEKKEDVSYACFKNIRKMNSTRDCCALDCLNQMVKSGGGSLMQGWDYMMDDRII